MSGRRYKSRLLDVSGGLQSGVSDYGAKVRHLAVAENVEFRPYRSCRVRKGSQRMTAATIDFEPHTLMEWVAAAGTSNKYAACKGAVNGRIYRVAAGAKTLQTLPISLAPATWLVWDQLNGAIFATENSGTQHPFVYRASNPADTWLDAVFPAPGATMTLTPGNTATGAMTSAIRYAYRLRWTYADGSSQASAPQEVLMGGADDTVAVTTIPLGTARSDCTGWILERTSAGTAAASSTTGLPFYYVAQGAGNAFNTPGDIKADADLGYRSNDNWYTGIPAGHFDGIIALPNRLAGWVGSTVYISQPIADDSSAGILNFDGRNAYDFGLGDGDSIKSVVRQNDRLIVFKEKSWYVLEGNDPSNYSVVPMGDGVGCSGCRAAASMGSTVWVYGIAGLHKIEGNSIVPFGYVEVGDEIEGFNSARLADVVVRNHLGQRVIIAFSKHGNNNDRMIVHDLRFKAWSVWTRWSAQDILVPKVIDFGDHETFLIADPIDRQTGGAADFPLWMAFYGFKDERAFGGSGGANVLVSLKTPWIDDGQPNAEKVFAWLQVYAGGALTNMTAQIETDPASQTANLSLTLPSIGELWGAKKWGQFTWGVPPNEASAEGGIAVGVRGRRYRITYNASCPNAFGFRGHVLDCILQPQEKSS